MEGTVLQDDPEYKLIVDCNQLSVDIENEIVIVHNFIRDKYRLKFQELESLVNDPIDYARVVKKIGNERDLRLVDLEGLLPSALTTKGNPLPHDVLQKTLEACDRALELDSARKKVLDFVESKMGSIAPNLSAVVGSAVAAKLMGTAGGLSELAKMPACNVQVLGHKRKNLAAFSSATSVSRVVHLEQTEIFQSTPPAFRMRTGRLLAANATLAASVDATRGDPSGTNGKALREMIRKEIEKWQEPPPARQPTPLPDEIDGDDGKEEEDFDMDMADLETLNYDDLDTVSKLQKSQRYVDIMQKVEEAVAKKVVQDNKETHSQKKLVSFGRLIPQYLQKHPEAIDVNHGFESAGKVKQRFAWELESYAAKVKTVAKVNTVAVAREAEAVKKVSKRVQRRRDSWAIAFAMARRAA